MEEVSDELDAYMGVEVIVKLRYELPRDPNLRHSIYQETDLRKCVQIDLDNDPAAVLCESDDLKLMSVIPLES